VTHQLMVCESETLLIGRAEFERMPVLIINMVTPFQ